MIFKQESIEITLLEDPACNWCWAFQPILTTLLFEFCGERSEQLIATRRLFGGLRDRPMIEPSLVQRHWQMAAGVSGMPLNPEIWDRHLLTTTYEACRAVIAASLISAQDAHRLLRKLREAFFVELIPIDNREAIFKLAETVSIDIEQMRDHLDSGRADFLFQRDRREASCNMFGFPTLIISRVGNEAKTVLHGMVPYQEIIDAILRLGFPPRLREQFNGSRADWVRLFSIHPRLTSAEIRRVTGISGPELEEQFPRHGIQLFGAFYSLCSDNGTRAAV